MVRHHVIDIRMSAGKDSHKVSWWSKVLPVCGEVSGCSSGCPYLPQCFLDEIVSQNCKYILSPSISHLSILKCSAGIWANQDTMYDVLYSMCSYHSCLTAWLLHHSMCWNGRASHSPFIVMSSHEAVHTRLSASFCIATKWSCEAWEWCHVQHMHCIHCAG